MGKGGTALKNQYELRGDKVAIFLVRRDGKKLETIIDLEDLEKVKLFKGKWCAAYGGNSDSFYVKGNLKGKTIHLHRYLLNAPKYTHVDHINHDTLDNTKLNLRITTPAENQQNRKTHKNSKSGERGVVFNKLKNKWQIDVKGSKRFQRSFNRKEDAIAAVKKARSVYMPFSVEDLILSNYTEDDLLKEYPRFQRR